MAVEVLERDLVLEELLAIEERDGVLKSEAVVEFAENPETELHNHFDWNNKTAGYQWRLWQARQLIRAKVTVIKNNGDEIVTNAFVHIEEDEDLERGYRSIAVILSDADLKSRMLATALKELQTFKKKYAHLKELTHVFEAIEEVL